MAESLWAGRRIERISISYSWLSCLNSPPKIEIQLKRTVRAQPITPMKNDASRTRMIQIAIFEAILDLMIVGPCLQA